MEKSDLIQNNPKKPTIFSDLSWTRRKSSFEWRTLVRSELTPLDVRARIEQSSFNNDVTKKF